MGQDEFASKLVLLDEKTTADLLGVSKRWLQSRRQVGDGPTYIKVGRLVRYKVDDLETWIASNRRRSTLDSSKVPKLNV